MMNTGVDAYQAKVAQVEAVSASVTREQNADYGRTVGEPKLSDEAKKYYNQLKQKFGNYDFVLVSRDEKENAKANASRYANGIKTVVLIDEDKIERMATDAAYRKQYEDILSGAASQLESMKQSMGGLGADVKGYGMQVNDNGTVSFFAVLKEMSQEQKERIEKHAKEKQADHKKEVKEENQEKLKELTEHDDHPEKTVTISAGSVEELMLKIEDYSLSQRSDAVRTDEERMLGQHIDFRG